MKVYVLTAESVYDCNGDLFSNGYVIGVFSSYELAEQHIPADDYTRKQRDYDIEEFTVK